MAPYLSERLNFLYMSLTNSGMNELINKELKAQSKSLGFRPARKLFPVEETLNSAMGLSSSQRRLAFPPESETQSEVSSVRPVSENSRRSKVAVTPYYYESLPGVEASPDEASILPEDSASNICGPPSTILQTSSSWHALYKPRPF